MIQHRCPGNYPTAGDAALLHGITFPLNERMCADLTTIEQLDSWLQSWGCGMWNGGIHMVLGLSCRFLSMAAPLQCIILPIANMDRSLTPRLAHLTFPAVISPPPTISLSPFSIRDNERCWPKNTKHNCQRLWHLSFGLMTPPQTRWPPQACWGQHALFFHGI